jgi:hypothetical protein
MASVTDVTVNATVPIAWLEQNPRGLLNEDGLYQFYRGDGTPLATSLDFGFAALGLHVVLERAEWSTGSGGREIVVEVPPIDAPTYQGFALYAYWTADGEQPALVPITQAVVRGTVQILAQAVAINPAGEIEYDGNRYLTGEAPMADGHIAQIVIADAPLRAQAEIIVQIPPAQQSGDAEPD